MHPPDSHRVSLKEETEKKQKRMKARKNGYIEGEGEGEEGMKERKIDR